MPAANRVPSRDAAPVFGNSPQVEVFDRASVVPAGVAGAASPPMAHLREPGPSGLYQPVETRPATVLGAALPDPARGRRRDTPPAEVHRVGAAAVGAGLRSVLSEAKPALAASPDQRELELAEARAALAERPDAEVVLKARLIERFAARYQPSGGALNHLSPPPVRPAAWLHELRWQLLEAADPAERLMLLWRALRELPDQFPVYSEADVRRATEDDRRNSVALIGRLFGMRSLPGNAQLDTSFFDQIATAEAE